MTFLTSSNLRKSICNIWKCSGWAGACGADGQLKNMGQIITSASYQTIALSDSLFLPVTGCMLICCVVIERVEETVYLCGGFFFPTFVFNSCIKFCRRVFYKPFLLWASQCNGITHPKCCFSFRTEWEPLCDQNCKLVAFPSCTRQKKLFLG